MPRTECGRDPTQQEVNVGTDKTVTVVVMRHPQKTGRSADAITAFGAQQAFAAAQALAERFDNIGMLFFSGAKRTLQTAQIIEAALLLNAEPPITMRGFHFDVVFDQCFPGEAGRSYFFEQLDALKSEHHDAPKLSHALALKNELGVYARMGREAVTTALAEVADILDQEKCDTGLVVSHSPWTELASLHPEETPFGLGEADAVAYTLEADADGWYIASSELIRAPLEGKPL
ncbi:MAG: hypothetical protein COU35_02495 [Candidatus Magasanikbacteria bacterium CG10_big_fil_rev_8_21_14_0_10_47_10]|uniref:Histidine phosphatase family protein n=1 Tax=Candidatus Magasanikbacteria bacterium CG10_big_fil_rev_8_21_14_0_10_47_10 TaxID=1974652 RepID=A0A2H0TQI7_9BACT|nr:MAG: hypothetical protein COU35_02495 [Candidatus Magasanikbacteria bacterium CG10_big_fil_rev_8_21_14_0_10_47_10]